MMMSLPPHQALLTTDHNYTCGAIVLSDQWALTAAHCVWRKPRSVFHVVVGETDFTLFDQIRNYFLLKFLLIVLYWTKM